MHYIGVDFAVINDAGRLVKAAHVDTGVNNFMGFVRQEELSIGKGMTIRGPHV